MLRARAATLSVCCLWACAESTEATVDLEPSQRLALIAVRANGEIAPVPRLIGQGSIPLALEEGSTVISWVFDGDDLIDPNGRALDDTAKDELRIGTDPNQGCGRCLQLKASEPRMIHDGTSCTIPRGLEVKKHAGDPSEDAIEALRKKVFIHSPKPCACTDTAIPPPPPANARAMAPVPGLEPLEKVAVTSSGAVALFAERSVTWLAAADGERTIDPPFRGPVRGVLPLAGGELLAAAADPIAPTRTRYVHFDADGNTRIVEDDAELTPFDMIRGNAPNEIIVFGRRPESAAGERALVQRCFLDTRLTCSGLVPRNFLGNDERSEPPTSGVVLESGRVVALNEIGFMGLGRPPEASSWRWWSILRNDRLAREMRSAANGERVFICAGFSSTGGAQLYSVDLRTVTATSTEQELRALTQTVTPALTGGCSGFVKTAPDRIRVYFTDDRWRDVDADTGRQIAEGTTSTELGIRAPVVAVVNNQDHQVAISRDQGVFERRAGRQTFVHRHGPEAHDPYLIGAMIVRNGVFWAFSGLGDVRLIRGDTIERRTISGIPGEPSVAFLDESDKIWIGGALDARSGWMRVIDPTQFTSQPFEHRALTAAQPANVTQLAPGKVLIALRDGNSIDSSGAEIAPPSDDPVTKEIDPPQEIDPGQCSVQNLRAGAHGGPISGLTSSRGVTWGVGCSARFFRFDLDAQQRATITYLNLPWPPRELTTPGGQGEAPTSALALCPDHVLIAAAGESGAEEESGLMFELTGSRNDRADEVLLQQSERFLPVTDRVALAAGAPIFLLGDHNRVTVIGNERDRRSTVRHFGGDTVFRINLPITAAAHDPQSGRILLGSMNGWIFAVE